MFEDLDLSWTWPHFNFEAKRRFPKYPADIPRWSRIHQKSDLVNWSLSFRQSYQTLQRHVLLHSKEEIRSYLLHAVSLKPLGHRGASYKEYLLQICALIFNPTSPNHGEKGYHQKKNQKGGKVIGFIESDKHIFLKRCDTIQKINYERF